MKHTKKQRNKIYKSAYKQKDLSNGFCLYFDENHKIRTWNYWEPNVDQEDCELAEFWLFCDDCHWFFDDCNEDTIMRIVIEFCMAMTE